MNWLDIGVIVIIACCVFIGWQRGLVLTLYSFCGRLLSLFLAWQVYPFVNRVLLGADFVYQFIYRIVESSLDLDTIVAAESMRAQNEIINALQLPDFIIQSLQAGNNPVLYDLLKATSINEYIYSYLTVLCIDALSLILTFCVISALLHAILQSLNLITRLPVIHTLNHVGGLAVGSLHGLLLVWIAGLVIVLLVSAGIAAPLGPMIGSSLFAYRFIETNLILNFMR